MQTSLRWRWIVIGFWVGSAWAAPMVPASRDTVVCRVRASGEPRLRVVAPASAEEAVVACRHWIGRARASSDPRDLGRARAALGRWWSDAQAPVEVVVLRAVIRQSLHDFGPALEDLRSAVERQPHHAGAWRTMASVHLVRGEFDEARRCAKGCAGAGDVGGAMVLAAQLSGLDGDAAEAARMLEGWVGSPASARVGSDDRAWALGVLGEMRWRLGRVELAESAFREGLKETPSDPYLMAALSDLLLGAGRASEVLELLGPYERMDGLLLRLAEAGRATGHAAAGRWRSELESRFAKAQERGDRVHLREEARFRLRVCGDAVGAAKLAEENWQVQREPSDLALLLEAGRAVGDDRVIALAREWIRDRKGAWGLGREVGL